MRGRTVRLPLVVTVGLLIALIPAGPARAGGGCHASTVPDVAGTKVVLKENCFVQTILRVRPGQAVVWANADQVEHTVTGAAASWGSYDAVLPGQSVTYRFDRAGVYPYFCLLHPGMIGAVVVGNGGKAAATESGSSVVPLSSPVPESKAAPAAAEAPEAPVSASSPGPWRTVALVAMGLLVAAGVGLGAQRLGLRRSQARAQAG